MHAFSENGKVSRFDLLKVKSSVARGRVRVGLLFPASAPVARACIIEGIKRVVPLGSGCPSLNGAFRHTDIRADVLSGRGWVFDEVKRCGV